jgi:hypothetical protein
MLCVLALPAQPSSFLSFLVLLNESHLSAAECNCVSVARTAMFWATSMYVCVWVRLCVRDSQIASVHGQESACCGKSWKSQIHCGLWGSIFQSMVHILIAFPPPLQCNFYITQTSVPGSACLTKKLLCGLVRQRSWFLTYIRLSLMPLDCCGLNEACSTSVVYSSTLAHALSD